MTRITINGVSVDPISNARELSLAGLEAPDAAASDYVLIQVRAPLSPAQTEDLVRRGVVVQEYVSLHTYLCGYKNSDLTSIRALPFVAWANIYLKGFKVAPRLRSAEAPRGTSQIIPLSAAPSHSRTLHKVDIIFHEDVDTGSDALRTAIAAAARVDKETLPLGSRKVRLTVQERFLDDLADLDAVRVIHESPTFKLHNDVARSILNANVRINSTAYEGAGEVVAVGDTGFDKGSTTKPHKAFIGRVAKLYALGRPNKTDDTDGHGTHVCGSVLGDGVSAVMGGQIRGTAPRARLVVQSLLDRTGGLGGIPDDLTDLFEPPYRDDGARVHTNSWGSTRPGAPYDSTAREIDLFVWNNPDLVICFAAGNEGRDGDADGIIDPAQIGSESAAKNCITVGASESVRREIKADRPTYGSLGPSEFPRAPIFDDLCASNADGMAAFSSRGPTQERRFKPDIVAPGTSILSTHSRNARPATNTFGNSRDSDYFFDTGTSMATPLVAGCAAVLRETLVKNGTPKPSAALIKALLINGAVELIGQYSPSEAGPSPNNNSGFGRVNLADSVIIPGKDPKAGLGEGGPLMQGISNTIRISIPNGTPGNPGSAPASSAASGSVSAMGPGPTLKVTLVWSDPPGPDLQNDLDLIVVAADGTERHGNMGTAAGFDTVNNVEQVHWTHMPPGDAKLIIRATRITRFAQPYAYAWRIR
jgi:serine protease AprX